MSLTSKDAAHKNTPQADIDCLILDLGLYPTSDKFRQSVSEHQNNSQQPDNNITTIMDLNTEPMSDAKWDAVLDNILKAKRCITL